MTELRSVNEISQYLKKTGENPEGLNNEQIKDIESAHGFPLPDIYKQFLLLMGKSAGNYMIGSSVFYNDISSLDRWTSELISENQLDPLPDNAFVFWMHQGYQAAYFKSDEGNDPPVYYFSEGGQHKEFVLKEKSLTDFLLIQLKMS